MTTQQFRRRTERMARVANSDVAALMTFDWRHCARVTWADGTAGISGVVAVDAPGYRARVMVASLHDGAMAVR